MFICLANNGYEAYTFLFCYLKNALHSLTRRKRRRPIDLEIWLRRIASPHVLLLNAETINTQGIGL